MVSRSVPPSSTSATFAVIAAGGTAGHIIPALSIARSLVVAGRPESSLLFVGSSHGMEGDLVARAGFEIALMPGRGVPRRLTRESARAILGLAAASARCIGLMVRRRPRVVVTLGGHAGLPSSLAAVLLGIPLVVVEPNAVPGAANRLAGRFACASAVAFAACSLKHAVVTGNPVREDIAGLGAPGTDRDRRRRAARRRFGIPSERRMILAFGGSLGSRRINEAVCAMAALLRDREDIAVRHIVGRRDWGTLTGAPEFPKDGIHYEAVEYEEEMAEALAACDVVIARSGATTVAELTAAGLPSILVPLPGSPGDHQGENARALGQAAVVIEDALCTGATLADLVTSLIADERRLGSMADAARAMAHPDAAREIAAVIESCARPRRYRSGHGCRGTNATVRDGG